MEEGSQQVSCLEAREFQKRKDDKRFQRAQEQSATVMMTVPISRDAN